MESVTKTDWQEVIALGLVALVMARASFQVFRSLFGASLAQWLLRRGHVRLAMKLRFH